MFISELGKYSGASPKAIRMYEAMGLLGPIRRQGAYRYYSDDNVRQVQLIRKAQSLGFKLSEISSLLSASGGEPDWAQLMHFLEQKRTQIRQEIRRLQQLDAHIDSILADIAACGGGSDNPRCDLNKA